MRVNATFVHPWAGKANVIIVIYAYDTGSCLT